MRKWGVSILASLVMMAMMGQTVYAEDVPSDNYTVPSGTTYENNTHTGVTNNGVIHSNKTAGRISDNGSSTNHDAFVGSNFGKVDQNYGEIKINFDDVLTNESGGKVTANNAGGDVLYNYGTVTTNEGTGTENKACGTVTTNKSGGTVTTNCAGAIVKANSGTVSTNNGTVTTNKSGSYIENNNGTVATNESNGWVLRNYGVVTTNQANGNITNMDSMADSTHGAVGTNYGTVNTGVGRSSYIGTNFGTVNGASSGTSMITIINNYGEGVTAYNSTLNIGNQFYDINLNNTLGGYTLAYDTGFIENQYDPNNKKWIQVTSNGTPVTPSATIILTPASGYDISGEDQTDVTNSGCTYSVQKQADGTAIITIKSSTGSVNVTPAVFNLIIRSLHQEVSSGSSHHSSHKESVQKPIDPVDLLRAQIALAIMQGGKQIIHWNYGTSLPYDVMQLLSEHPDVTLDFTYNYQGGSYEAVLNGVTADASIPWYGPVYLNELYGVAK